MTSNNFALLVVQTSYQVSVRSPSITIISYVHFLPYDSLYLENILKGNFKEKHQLLPNEWLEKLLCMFVNLTDDVTSHEPHCTSLIKTIYFALRLR